MIIDLQRQVRQIGRIRIGEQVPTRNGKTAPSKLSSFRLTSSQRAPIDKAAELYGGEVRPMNNDRSDDLWQVTTEASSIPVVLPPTNHLDQWYEMWNSAGCERRCDGQEAIVMDGRPTRGARCACDPEQRECRITTRLFLVLPDLEALGTFRLETHGWYAATELAGAADLCAAATSRGAAIPARLDLEQRTRRSRGADGKPQTFKFAVPVLSVDVSLPQARAILGGLDVSTGEIQRPAAPAIEPKPIPADTADVDTVTSEEWASAGTAHEQHLNLVRSDPATRAAFESTAASIEQRQALPPPPPATIPAPRTHEQYEQASAEPTPLWAAAAQAQTEGRLSTPTRQGTVRPASTYEMNPDEASAFAEPEQRASKPPPAKPAENSKGANWHRSVAVLVPDETERRALIWLASAGRTSSANEAKAAERTKAHDWARAIHDGGCALDISDAGGVRMVALIDPDGNDIERHEQPRSEP